MYEELKARLSLCDQPNKGWPLMIEAADAIEQLKRQLAERDAEIAKYRNAPCVAYATTNEEDDLTMLFFDAVEARKYSGDDEPIKLIVKPGE